MSGREAPLLRRSCVICLFLEVARRDALASSECYRVAKWDNVMALQCEVLAV